MPLHLCSQIRAVNKINAWLGWLNSTSAPVKMSVSDIIALGFFFIVSREKYILLRFTFPISGDNFKKNNIHSKNLFLFLNCDYLCCKCLCYPMPTFDQTNLTLTYQEPKLSVSGVKGFASRLLWLYYVLHGPKQFKLHYFATYSHSSWFLTNV